MASADDQDVLTQEFKKISLEDSDMGGCAGKRDDRMEKDNLLKENSRFPIHTAKVLRIRRDLSLEDVKKEKQAIEKNTKCSISLAKKEDEEPSYYKSWVSDSRSIIIAEGNVENSVTDIIVCPIDEFCQPAGESAKRIFQKGGWTELENAAKCSKSEHEKTHGTGDANILYSSSTGSLNCRRIWFVYYKKQRDSMELLSNTLYDEVKKNYWRSIYFPVESSQILDGTVQKMADTFLKPSACKPLTGMEIVLCFSSGNRDYKQLDKICQKSLKGSKVISFYDETRSNVDEYTSIPCSCFQSPIEVKIEIESILDIAKKGKVDVIVNSTNKKLSLKDGFLSSHILKEGGIGIQNECDDVQGDINEGDILVSNAGKLHCKKIIHCVLINWISTGNLSLKVLSSLVKKCLQEVGKLGYETIAFPALGTGNLGYPYIHVARTMQKAVYEYGISFPKTCIRKVIFALHGNDRECIKTFQDVHDSDQIVKDFILNPTIQFLENRISKSGLLIQLMSQEINEPVDAIIKFTLSHSSSKYGHREQRAGGPVDLDWCKEKGCYTGTYIFGEEMMKLVVEECFTLLESMKITSTRIDIRNIGASKGFETVMNAFCDELTTATPRTTKACKIRYLRKLQILACQEEIEKVKKSQQRKSAEDESSLMKWITNLLKSGECDEKWKVVEKPQTKHMVCCLRGVTKDNVENAWEQLKRRIEAGIQGVGRWCFCQDNYKWKFVSKICNIKLIEAEEKLNMVDITDEDGITHTYNLEDNERAQKNPPGDVRKEKIRFIYDCETTSPSPSKSTMWAAFHKDKWTFLPMQCCHLLNDAAQQRKRDVKDNQNYVYDLENKKRTLQNNGSNSICEPILCIEAAADKTNHFADVKMENGHKDDFSVFEIVTGMIMHSEEYGNDVLKIIEDSGCTVMNHDDHSSVQISGSLEGIEKVNLHLTKKKRGDKNKRNPEEGTDYVIAIPMSERDYEAVSYFGNKHTWFKNITNNVKYIDGSLCVNELDVVDGQDIEKKLNDLFAVVQSMTSDNIQIPEEFKKDNVKKTIEEIEQMKPNVCLLWNENDIEIISDNYTELLQAKGLFQQKMSGKGNRRTGRTFTKEEKNQNLLLLERTIQDTNSNEMSVSMNQSMRSRKVELKTKEGLRIKIYTGSITRLDVDCIVNAANESLMHGGGVAAAISEAAGYQFDLESKKYVKDNGSIPVGRCCVTSAGKLPYSYVIHTVGPRWGDYRDKNRCLQDLKESVEVTFREADKMEMKTIAIPAISSGIFAVPRNNCVEEYYKAAMSFSRNYPFKSLQEIHFVDRDESMVRAIQETFQQKESSKSTLEKSENPGKEKDIPADGADYMNAQSVMPHSNPYTIVHVSDIFQVKIHLGKVTDVVADAIVCPQDEYLSSKNDIAMEIFNKLGCEPKSSNKKMNHGEISSENLHGNSPWKLIIHAVTPIYDCNYSKEIVKFGAVLKTMIQNIIEAAEEVSVGSVAIPLLGAGKEDFKTPVDLCASSFFKAVMDRKSKYPSLKEIYLVLDDDDMEYKYLEAFKYTCKITPRAVSKVGNSNIQNFGKTLTGCRKNDENCCICMDKLTNPKRLQKCGHTFCKECIEQYFQYKPACPSCGQIYGKMTGDQPPGSIMIRNDYKQKLEGFPDSKGCIILTYTFHNGRQGPEHPEQGQWYKGINRSGYVPNNEKGRLVAKLLNVAFSRRLVFTIGRSRTTGQEGVITWNDIHHKTRPYGGPAQFGYPDPTYLDRVLEELDAKGVTKESADDPEEYKEYSKLFGCY